MGVGIGGKPARQTSILMAGETRNIHARIHARMHTCIYECTLIYMLLNDPSKASEETKLLCISE